MTGAASVGAQGKLGSALFLQQNVLCNVLLRVELGLCGFSHSGGRGTLWSVRLGLQTSEFSDT